MFPNFCGAPGFAGWLAMLLASGVVVALAVWGVSRLFPDRPRDSAGTAPPRPDREPARPGPSRRS